MPAYKLFYFDARSHAEPIRLIFALAGVQYEDVRLCDDEWGILKESGKAPFGQLPILEVGDDVIAQSLSIMAYVAKEHGLAPSNAMEDARASMVSHALYDMGETIMKFALEWDDDLKKKMKGDFFEYDLPKHLSFFEKVLKSNTKGNGFFAGNKVSYADIHFFSIFNSLLVEGRIESPEGLEGYPALLELYNRIMNVPKIKEWMKIRPESDI